MRFRRMGAVAILTGIAVAGALPVIAADEVNKLPGRVQMTDHGPVLVTTAGMTLYVNRTDLGRPGKSTCTNEPKRTVQDVAGGFGAVPRVRADEAKSCADITPPYLASADAKPVGDWSLIDRPEGNRKQWTYQGQPLYTSIRDHKPGDVNEAWGRTNTDLALAMDSLDFPPGFALTEKNENLILAKKADRQPVYTPRNGRKCSHDCDHLFAPMIAPAIARVNGDWTLVDAGAGRKQYAFRGKPLYQPAQLLSTWDVEEGGTWEPVLFRQGAGLPPEIRKRQILMGDVYTTRNGMTLYVFQCFTGYESGADVRCDNPGDPAQYWAALCKDSETCAKRWHPYLAAAGAKRRGDWDIVDVSYPVFLDHTGITYPPEAPRVKAWAYRGTPVWTYYKDEKPGDFRGHGVRLVGPVSFIGALIAPEPERPNQRFAD